MEGETIWEDHDFDYYKYDEEGLLRRGRGAQYVSIVPPRY